MRAYKLLLPSGWPGRELERQSHEGYEWVYVLDGRLRLLLGKHDVVLTAGEAAEFDTRTPHAMGNPDDDITELLALFGPRASVPTSGPPGSPVTPPRPWAGFDPTLNL